MPVDVLATLSVNSRIGRADRIRQIHRDMARTCNPLLTEIPVDADLLSFDPSLESVKRLVSAAMVNHVLVSRATKVLHRKRRALIPVLDAVVIDNHYVAAAGKPWLKGKAGDSNRSVSLDMGMTVLPVFREDLRIARDNVTSLQFELSRHGFVLSHLRILEILIWTETEPLLSVKDQNQHVRTITLRTPAKDIAEAFNLGDVPNIQLRLNIAPT